ncbi:MAG: hypothetical protein ABJL67_09650 [Sulfitobacter sp.]
MTEQEWGPWIELCGTFVPEGIAGKYLHVVLDMTGYLPDGVMVDETFGLAIGNPENWLFEEAEYCTITRYRIRKPRALTELIEMVETLPERQDA